MPPITTTTAPLLTHLLHSAREVSATPNPPHVQKPKKSISGWAIFLIVLIVLLILGAIAWLLYTRLRARRLGLPPPPLNPFAARSGPSSNYPAPAPGGVKGWLDTQIRKFKNRRYATGAYEEPAYGGAGAGRARGRGGRGPLDPDEAWDSRVGNEAYYEEQELGLHAPAGSTAYGGPTGYTGAYGRELDERYEEEVHAGGKHSTNPFGDDNAVSSLRGVSPRPLETERAGGAYGAPGHKKTGSAESSPTERRSMFRENM